MNLFQSTTKQIVIITKHWTNLTDEQLKELALYNVCVNTSVSALDGEILANGLTQFERLKPFCKSILRVVSADFNQDNETGLKLSKVQDELFKHGVLDTVLRVSNKNPIVIDGIIKVKRGNFMGKKQYMSKHNPKTYVGKCSACKEMCGVNMT